MSNIIIFGSRGVGKARLAYRMVKPEEYPANADVDNSPRKTSAALTINDSKHTITVFNTEQSHPSQGETINIYYQKMDIGLYCINLSKNNNLDKMIADIRLFRISNANAPLVFVGIAEQLDDSSKAQFTSLYEQLQQKLLEDNIHGFVQPSMLSIAYTDEERETFLTSLENLTSPKTQLLTKISEQLPANAPFTEALNHFSPSSKNLTR